MIKTMKKLYLENKTVGHGYTSISCYYVQSRLHFKLVMQGSTTGWIAFWWKLTKFVFLSKGKQFILSNLDRRNQYDPVKMEFNNISRNWETDPLKGEVL